MPLRYSLIFALLFALQSCAAQPTPTPQIAVGETTQQPARRPCYECLPTPKRRKPAQIVAYIRSVAPTAIAVETRYGVPAYLSIAVAIYESGGGQSSIAQNSNNHFGMRYFACGGEFQYIDSPRPYRCQKGRLWQSFRTVADAYAAFAQTHAIQILRAENKPITPENFAGTGYGGRKNKRRYAKALAQIIEQYNLRNL